MILEFALAWHLYKLKDPPKKPLFAERTDHWAPYRSIGAWYLWRLADSKRPMRKTVPKSSRTKLLVPYAQLNCISSLGVSRTRSHPSTRLLFALFKAILATVKLNGHLHTHPALSPFKKYFGNPHEPLYDRLAKSATSSIGQSADLAFDGLGSCLGGVGAEYLASHPAIFSAE